MAANLRFRYSIDTLKCKRNEEHKQPHAGVCVTSEATTKNPELWRDFSSSCSPGTIATQAYWPDIFWCWSQSAQTAGVLPEATSSLPELWWEQLCSSRSTLPKTTVGSIARLQSAVVLAALITFYYRVVILVFQNHLRYKSIIDLCD